MVNKGGQPLLKLTLRNLSISSLNFSPRNKSVFGYYVSDCKCYIDTSANCCATLDNRVTEKLKLRVFIFPVT